MPGFRYDDQVRMPFDPPDAIWSIIRYWAPDRGPERTLLSHKNDTGGVPAVLVVESSNWMARLSKTFLADWDGRTDLTKWKNQDKAVRQASRWLLRQADIARKLLSSQRVASMVLAESEPFVVIGNYGRGEQTCWPSGPKPKTYTKAQAEAIVARLEKEKSGIGSGSRYDHCAWHAKPLSEALNYVSPGNTCYNALYRMQVARSYDYEE